MEAFLPFSRRPKANGLVLTILMLSSGCRFGFELLDDTSRGGQGGVSGNELLGGASGENPSTPSDTDGDGVVDDEDDYPTDPTRCQDADGDGCDDCASGSIDPDADGVDLNDDGTCEGQLAHYVVAQSTHLPFEWYAQRQTAYSQGRHWVFYPVQEEIRVVSSVDGETWTAADSAFTAGVSSPSEALRSSRFAVATHQNEVHVAHAPFKLDTPFGYHKGTLQSDGTITWSSPAEVIPPSSTVYWRTPNIAVDASGNVLLTYNPTEDPAGLQCCLHQHLRGKYGDTTDGSWTTASGWPQSLAAANRLWAWNHVPLADGSIYAFYCNANGPATCKGRSLTSEILGPEEDLSAHFNDWTGHTAVAWSNEVHIAMASAGKLHIVSRIDGAWSSSDVPLSDAAVVAPQITQLDPDTGDLAVSWLEEDDRIRFVVGVRDGDSYAWDPSPRPCAAESVGISGHTAHARGPNGELWVFYGKGTTAPYSVKAARCLR